MPSVLMLTHVECEGPGLWGDFLDESGVCTERVRLNDGDELPDADRYDALLVLGGPMNVDDDDIHPWLPDERVYVRRAVNAGQPVIGLCLGSQLLARALGAEATKNPVKEIGWGLVTLTDVGRRDPLFDGCEPLLPVFQWHGDTFALPGGAELLATSTLCAHQAFRYGERVYGLQFHVEVTPPMVAEWLDEYRDEASRELPHSAADRMIEQARATADEIAAQSRRIFENVSRICGIG